MQTLRTWVDGQLNMQEEINDLTVELRRLQHDLDETANSLNAAGKMWSSAKRFLLHHGVRPPSDPWWFTREAKEGEDDEDDPVDRPIPGLP